MINLSIHIQIILPPGLPACSNKDSRFVMLNRSLTCWVALMISMRQPRVRALTYKPTTVPRPELSICGTPCKSSTIRFRCGISGFTSSFNEGAFSNVNLPKHSTTVAPTASKECTRNPRAELLGPSVDIKPPAAPPPTSQAIPESLSHSPAKHKQAIQSSAILLAADLPAALPWLPPAIVVYLNTARGEIV